MKFCLLFGALTIMFMGAACTARTGPSSVPMEKGAQDRPVKMPGGKDTAFKPGEILVRFKAAIPEKARQRFCAKTHLSLLHRFRSPGLYLFSIEDEKGVPEKIEEVKKHPLVAYVEPNYLFTLNPPEEKPSYPAGEALVRFSPKTERSRVEAIFRALGLELVETFPLPNLFRVKATDPSKSVDKMIQQLISFPEVLYAEPNYRFSLDPSNPKGNPLK